MGNMSRSDLWRVAIVFGGSLLAAFVACAVTKYLGAEDITVASAVIVTWLVSYFLLSVAVSE